MLTTRNDMAATDRSSLTPRQADIAALLRKKRSNKLIAKELGISHFTVRNHVTILLRRLDVQTRDRIAGQAIALGLIEPINGDVRFDQLGCQKRTGTKLQHSCHSRLLQDH